MVTMVTGAENDLSNPQEMDCFRSEKYSKDDFVGYKYRVVFYDQNLAHRDSIIVPLLNILILGYKEKNNLLPICKQ